VRTRIVVPTRNRTALGFVMAASSAMSREVLTARTDCHGTKGDLTDSENFSETFGATREQDGRINYRLRNKRIKWGFQPGYRPKQTAGLA